MNNISHWTPRYLYNRTRLMLYTKAHPGLPWLTRDAIELLEQLIKPTDVLLEFGSGRSTIWFAQRCRRVISIEHHPHWHKNVSEQLQQK